ncbi:C40 family peptidase, partial [Desulfococcaceae bacterium HSG8]|nr:C40 family peptidase [Desulfococcaceae bacterium HSG8]
FKYFILALAVMSFYSCSALRKASVYRSKTIAHPEIIGPQSEAVSEAVKKTDEGCECENVTEPAEDFAESDSFIEEDEDIPEMSVHQIENCTVSEMGTADDNCGSGVDEYVPDEYASDDPFYANYSEKLGLWFEGSEDKDLIMAVDEWFGTRYKWGGCSKYGVDCSCFVKSVYEDVYGITLNRTSRGMYYKDLVPINREELREGDILCFKIRSSRVSHVGIYLKDGKFVHSGRSKGVMINDLDESYYKKRFFTGGRVMGKEDIRLSKLSKRSGKIWR